MNKKKKRIIISIVTAGIIVASTTGFYFLKKSMNGESNKAVALETYTVPSSDKVFINGIVSPEKTENIYLEPAKGVVSKVSVENGQNVDKGDALFTYKNEVISIQIEQLETQISNIKNGKKEVVAKQQQAKEQAQALLQQGADANMSQNMVEANMPSISNAVTEKFSTEGIDEQIKGLEKQLKTLKDKEYTTIKAPIKGKVILHEGEKNPMTPYMTIESLNYYVNGNVSEKDQHKLKENQIVDITVLSTNTNLKGKIKSVGDRPISAPMPSGMEAVSAGGNNNISYYLVNINLDDQGKATNGFHVQATINLEAQPIKIPKTAIIKDENGDYVFKSVDKKLVKQPVAYSEENETDKVIVSNGLGENDEVVTKVNADMKEGMSVE